MWNKILAVGADKASRSYLMWTKPNLLYEDCHNQMVHIMHMIKVSHNILTNISLFMEY